MSILLEALRKSEKNQQPHAVPTIHDDDQADSLAESLKIAPLAMLLVVALFVTGWLVWRQYQAPPGIYQPPVTLESDQVRRVTKPAGEQQKGADVTQTAAKQDTTRQSANVQKRTPVETFEQPAEAAPRATPSKAKSTAGGGASNAAANTAAPPRKKAVAATETRPREPAPISYWELPDAIRASVPEIKFSVLVYAKDPAARFVLINGARFREGDSLPSGPVVGEIRREGVVFTYRLYRFLVER